MSFIKHQNLPDGHKMAYFNVVSLFTNVPLDTTIEIIIERIYDNNGINISITKNKIKKTYFAMYKGSTFYF